MSDDGYYTVSTAEDVTSEILAMVMSIVDGWYQDGPIDWENVWERLEGYTLDDDRQIDMGSQSDTPAIRKIKKHVRAHRHD